MSFFKNIFKKEPEVEFMVNITDIGPVSCSPRYKNTLEMASDRIRSLKEAYRMLEVERDALKRELDALQPVIEDIDYKPAKSRECYKCHYGIKLPYTYDGQAVYGCRKDMICEDFREEEDE